MKQGKELEWLYPIIEARARKLIGSGAATRKRGSYAPGDLAQDVFEKLLKAHVDKRVPTGRTEATRYAFDVLKNTWLDLVRGRTREILDDDGEPEGAATDAPPSVTLELPEAERLWNHADAELLAAMPEEERRRIHELRASDTRGAGSEARNKALREHNERVDAAVFRVTHGPCLEPLEPRHRAFVEQCLAGASGIVAHRQSGWGGERWTGEPPIADARASQLRLQELTRHLLCLTRGNDAELNTYDARIRRTLAADEERRVIKDVAAALGDPDGADDRTRAQAKILVVGLGAAKSDVRGEGIESRARAALVEVCIKRGLRGNEQEFGRLLMRGVDAETAVRESKYRPAGRQAAVAKSAAELARAATDKLCREWCLLGSSWRKRLFVAMCEERVGNARPDPEWALEQSHFGAEVAGARGSAVALAERIRVERDACAGDCLSKGGPR